eukprot:NODE_227_length_13866_cov_0.400305.p2 type:complete len:666 gc:universal NODE_227_length_13866_cov_0.400305:7229-9226(+)
MNWLPSEVLNKLSDQALNQDTGTSSISSRSLAEVVSSDEIQLIDSRSNNTIIIESDDNDSFNVSNKRLAEISDHSIKKPKSNLLYQSSENDVVYKYKNVIMSDSDDSNSIRLLDSVGTDLIDLISSDPSSVTQTATSNTDLQLLDLFNNLNSNLLADYTNLDVHVMDQLILKRPFDSIDILKYHLKSVKASKALNNAQIKLTLLKDLDDLLSQVESYSNQLSQLNMPSVDSLPPNIKSQIKPYQLQGACWMMNLFISNVGGILGDEMGLGKTLQTILLISFLHSKQIKPTLVIVPLSTLDNWEREIEKWDPTLTFAVYHACKAERDMFDTFDFKQKDIILTTYHMACGSKEDRKFLLKCKPKVLILDEGHSVKNCSTMKYKQLNLIPARTKILLTGTPVNNNLKEIMSLLAFVVPDLFNNYFDTLDKLLHCKQDELLKSRIDKAALLLKPFLLRRYKREHMLDLPKKTVHNVMLELTKKQRKLYDEQVELGTSCDTNSTFLVKMLELRKICNSPLLIQFEYRDLISEIITCALKLGEYRKHSQQTLYDYFSGLNDYELHQIFLSKNVFKSFPLDCSVILKNSCKLDYLRQKLPNWIANGDKILIFSQFLLVLDLLQLLMEEMEIVTSCFNLGIFIIGRVNIARNKAKSNRRFQRQYKNKCVFAVY